MEGCDEVGMEWRWRRPSMVGRRWGRRDGMEGVKEL